MTVDFAKEYLLDDCADCPENKNGECMTESHCFEVKRMAIQALEQEPVIDKIRAEIEQMDFDFGDFYDHTRTIRGMVLEVFDKYKTESEE